MIRKKIILQNYDVNMPNVNFSENQTYIRNHIAEGTFCCGGDNG